MWIPPEGFQSLITSAFDVCACFLKRKVGKTKPSLPFSCRVGVDMNAQCFFRVFPLYLHQTPIGVTVTVCLLCVCVRVCACVLMIVWSCGSH